MAINTSTLGSDELRRANQLSDLRSGMNPLAPGLPSSTPRTAAGAWNDPTNSPVSWGAIVAGAVAAAALSLILLMLGVGLGLSSVSPWAQGGVSAGTFGVGTILWLTLTQLVASAMGGYLAGRLRTQWLQTHTDEIYFRDTAHGFLAWALASLATAALLSSAVASIVAGGVQTGATVMGGAAAATTAAMGGAAASTDDNGAASGSAGPLGYFVDSLFRNDNNAPNAVPAVGASPDVANSGSNIVSRAPGADSAGNAEILRIFVNNVRAPVLASDDARQVAQIVAQRTGMPMADAQKRVTEVYAKAQTQRRDAELAARSAADKARKASAYGALWLFISLLMGAFAASWAATFGGRGRDT